MDMTEEKKLPDSREVAKLQEEVAHLRRVNAMKDRLFSIISHDIRSPLNTLSSLVDTMIKYADAFSPEEIRNFSLDVKDSLNSVRFLLENLLQWSLAQMDKIEYKPDRISLRTLTEQNVHLFEAAAKAKKITLKLAYEAEEEVFADRDMIDFVLRNLLSNALKFTEEGGLVTINVQTHRTYVTVSVEDNGVGIDPETQAKLFDRETLISTFGTSSEKGTGLGLIMCREFVRISGGEISVESEVGQGSRFLFTIPHVEPPQPA
jgi:signal transduction histidine kinase